MLFAQMCGPLASRTSDSVPWDTPAPAPCPYESEGDPSLPLAASQVAVEELPIRLRGLDAVLLLAEAVPFVGEHEVLHRHLVGTHRLDHLVTLDLQDPRVVRPLDDQQRLADVLRMEQGRDAPEPLAVCLGVA